jgi:hypothetical protein
MNSNSYEAEDLQLTENLIFKPNGLSINQIPRGEGKSADLEVLLNEITVAYCELKSPHDGWLDNLIDTAQTCEIVGGIRSDPVFKKITKHANKASKQFEAVNPERTVPNILVFVNHDDISDFGDLIETFTGQFHAADGSRHLTMVDIALSLGRAKKNIDLCVWIDKRTLLVQGFFFNRDTHPNYLSQLCLLFRKNPADIKY